MKSFRYVQLQLTFNTSDPIYQQIKAYIIREIMRGRLLPGVLLPGSRILAQQLKVNRNTVILAYEQLAAAGWVTSHYKSGTRVSERTPSGQLSPPAHAPDDQQALKIPFRHIHPSLSPSYPNGNYNIIFDDGLPDLKQLPWNDINRECRRLLQQDDYRLLLHNNSEQGNKQLLQEVNSMLNNDRGLAITTEHICLTRGSQTALYLTAQTLLLPGDHVAVEHPGYQPAWQAFTVAGAQLHYIPCDGQGINIEALEQCCQTTPLKALYITPHHQYPTTVTLSPERRKQLLLLSEQYHFMIIEDDYDYEYHFQTHNIPLAGMPHAGNVIYTGAVMHTLPVNFVCGPPAFIQSLAAYQTILNKEGDPILQQAMANLLVAGDIQKQIHQMRAVYEKKLAFTSDIVHTGLTSQVHYTQPQGGLAIWLQLYKQVPPEQLLKKIQSAGVNVVHPLSYYVSPAHPAMGLRLGYASLKEAVLAKGLEKLAKVLQQL